MPHVRLAVVALCGAAWQPTEAPRSWTWRGGAELSPGESGIYGPCNHWQQHAWEECLLATTPQKCEDELGLVACTAFDGEVWPGARYGHDMARDPATDDAWLFGGVGHAATDAGAAPRLYSQYIGGEAINTLSLSFRPKLYDTCSCMCRVAKRPMAPQTDAGRCPDRTVALGWYAFAATRVLVHSCSERLFPYDCCHHRRGNFRGEPRPLRRARGCVRGSLARGEGTPHASCGRRR